MNPRNTGILFVVAAALFAFVYFYEIRGADERADAEEASRRIFAEVDADEIEEIALTTSDGVAARFAREERGWRVVEPVEFPGDTVALDGLASTLSQLTSEGVIQSPQPREVYALDDEMRVVTFRADEMEYALHLGRKTPVGSNSYVAAADDDRIYTVPTWRVNSLRKALADLRDRQVLDFDRESVDRVRVVWPGAQVLLEKRPDGWWLVEPIEELADQTVVDTLLSDLSFLRAEGFRDDPAPDSETGLDEPAFVVELQIADETGQAREVFFALSSKVEDDRRLARSSHETLYEVPDERLADFRRRVVDYRFRELSSFVASEAERLEIVFTDEAEEPLAVSADRRATVWTSAPQPMEPAKISDIVAELAQLKGTDIELDSASPEDLVALGLDPPRVTIRVLADVSADAEPVTLAEVHLGVADPERGIAVRTPGRDTVYRIDYELADQLPLSAAAFRDRFVAIEEPDPEPPAEFSSDPELE